MTAARPSGPGGSGTGLPRAFKIDSERRLLIDAFARVATSLGYAETTPARVAQRAGLSESVFYEHFDSLEDCFLAAFDEAVEQASAAALEAAARESDRERRIEAGFTAFMEFASAEPTLARLLIVDSLSAGPRVLERRSEALEQFAQHLDRHRLNLDDGIGPLASRVLVGGIYAVIYARLLRGESDTLPDLVPGLRYFWQLPFEGDRGDGANGGGAP
ncbi:MAG: TetR/AcrR family transcriptional regulator [Thermoleophilaceae bacterium]|nr:TetR/AcrR family transcriptional regulator [Thermoleophilaceae bacterium]